jgi:hypothetical protein
MSGVNTKQKSVWGLMSGVNTKMKNGYGLMSGVNTKVFSSAIEWTYTIQASSDVKTYSVTADYTAYAEFYTGDSSTDRYTDTTFTFKGTVQLPATAAIGYNVNSSVASTFYVYVNGTVVFSTTAGAGNINLSGVTDVSTIRVRIVTNSKTNMTSWVKLTLNPIGVSSFLLNNAGIKNI